MKGRYTAEFGISRTTRVFTRTMLSGTRRGRKKFMLSGVLGVAFLILADYLSLMFGNSYLLIAINPLFIAWIEVWVIQPRRTTTKLRARWKKEHGIL